ncbi:LTA synthase family protein [Luteolibacter yonseiensis]|uniref:LTA synthase family protein n=2 Tax=Luteolibacter yonseiensis TaxID=1144680 RepID=A0A934R4W2_9BACT|nr:LTA synthase family protein [Luteolibacter yonseiensis]MBK1816989.1 LTA synthase family protein [Luteolibacter yonseiensis]
MISRLALFLQAGHQLTPDSSLLGAFACGLFFDAISGLFAAIPWVLYGAVMPERFLKSIWGKWTTASLMVAFSGLLIFITVSEWFFWNEFGARFNFIAVDYLIWTQEVLGNITESYPMGPILCGIALLSCGLVWLIHGKGIMTWAVTGSARWEASAGWLAAGLGLSTLAAHLVSQSSLPAFSNQYHGELAKNGCWSFFAAFKQMELNYDQWYPRLSQKNALMSAKKLLVTENEQAGGASTEDLHRVIQGRGDEHQWNVMLICMESMSGSYMAYAGGEKGITPNLDRLAKESLFFNNLFATGTRTVRGMEALTLNLPPTPGQSIIYRPEGTNLTTTFSPFLKRGYDCAFFYGGDGRFDYMNRYFSTSGCRIMDVKEWDKKDVTFKTSWGACDEDLFNKAIAEADKDHARNKPFHYFCMTTSNHRPYDFPDGRIDLKSHTGRDAAVKYADWAVGKLIEDASKKPWFKETLFVICSDHCAGSAGKSDLDVTKFHIPAMIYNPGLVPARQYSKLCSQIDVIPTVFGLLNWNYETLSYGHDLLSSETDPTTERAFISNYQKIALLRKEHLVILKPKRQSSLYSCDIATGDLIPLKDEGEEITRDAISYYQSASWLFGSGGLKAQNRKAGKP